MTKVHMKLSLMCYMVHSGLFLGLFFDIEYVDDVPPKRRLTFTGLHGVISQKIPGSVSK
jgi:hypothetical protein